MNWKWVISGVLGIFVGLSIAPFAHRSVLASSAPVSTHFQIEAATADESNGQGQRVPVHEAFLLDTESGKVWQFSGASTIFDRKKGEAIPVGPSFIRFPVESIK